MVDCWRHELESATTECEILHYADDFLQLWVPREILPAMLGLQQVRIETSRDLECVHAALALGKILPGADSRQSAHIRELVTYFRRAAVRLTQVRAARRGTATAVSTPEKARVPSERAAWAADRMLYR